MASNDTVDKIGFAVTGVGFDDDSVIPLDGEHHEKKQPVLTHLRADSDRFFGLSSEGGE